jgi:hypothetical protein
MGVGQTRAVAECDGFLSQQTQRPAGPPFRWLTTGEGGNAGSLFAINTDGAARARLLVQSLPSRLQVAIPPAGHALPAHLQRFRNLEQGVTGLQLEQGRSPLEGAGPGYGPDG